MNNTRLFGRVGMTLSSVLVLLHIATLAQAKVKAPKDCPDKDKAIPIGVPIDFCRVAHLTPMLLQRASEPGFGSGSLLAQIGNNRGYQYYFKRFFVITDYEKDPGKVIVDRTFVVKDLKKWVPIYAKQGRNIVELRAKKINVKGGIVTVRFYTNVLSGSHKDFDLKITFSPNNEPEMFIQDKVFNSLEITPSRLFNKPVGIGILRFEYYGAEALTLNLV